MTENEVRKYIEELREKARLFGKSGYATAGMEKAFNKSADTIENLLNELELYRAIGTIEEFKALKEKNTPKKPYKGRFGVIRCSCCDEKVGQMVTSVLKEDCMNFCAYCGSKVDWSE